jgi:hypothetical protein
MEKRPYRVKTKVIEFFVLLYIFFLEFVLGFSLNPGRAWRLGITEVYQIRKEERIDMLATRNVNFSDEMIYLSMFLKLNLIDLVLFIYL